MTEREFIEKLADEYIEKRSDVTEICEIFLKTGKFTDDTSESRYVQANIPNTDIRVEYDTLTTLIEYHRPLSQWAECTHHTYRND